MTRRTLHRLLAPAVALAAALLAQAAAAVEYRSLAAPAILYDSPSERARRVAIGLPGTPVELIVGLDRWVKVRDASGKISWVSRQLITERRTVMVNVPRLIVRAEASASAPVSFEAARDVVLELLEQPRFGWIKVRHEDGSAGFARAIEVWGL